MSRGTMKVYVGNLPPDVRTRDIKDVFKKYGDIRDVDLKNVRGPPFAFIEFEDQRDASDAVKARDGYKMDGYTLRVEFSRSSDMYRGDRQRGGFSGRGRGPSRRGEFRVVVSGLPTSGSWQDLKDHMREAGDVGYADVRGSVGHVEFLRYEDMKQAIKKLDNSRFKSHEGESATIRVREDNGSASGGGGGGRDRSPPPSRSRSRSLSRSRSRSRTRSPPPRRRGSPTYSPMRNRSRSRSNSRSRSRSYS